MAVSLHIIITLLAFAKTFFFDPRARCYHAIDSAVPAPSKSYTHGDLLTRDSCVARLAAWANEIYRPDRTILALKLAFSCIILFQTGRVDIDPEDLEGAMAISHNSSIFVAQSILADPFHSNTFSLVRRILGNVGKPGLAILIPPSAPEVRERSLRDWRVVTHAPFDSKYSRV